MVSPVHFKRCTAVWAKLCDAFDFVLREPILKRVGVLGNNSVVFGAGHAVVPENIVLGAYKVSAVAAKKAWVAARSMKLAGLALWVRTIVISRHHKQGATQQELVVAKNC